MYIDREVKGGDSDGARIPAKSGVSAVSLQQISGKV